MADLTRNGIVGLELTREEVIDLKGKLCGVKRKAECREVNCDILDMLAEIADKLELVEFELTQIIEGEE